MALPASLLGKERLQAGDTFSLRASLTGHSRSARMEWKTLLRLGHK